MQQLLCSEQRTEVATCSLIAEISTLTQRAPGGQYVNFVGEKNLFSKERFSFDRISERKMR